MLLCSRKWQSAMNHHSPQALDKTSCPLFLISLLRLIDVTAVFTYNKSKPNPFPFCLHQLTKSAVDAVLHLMNN